MDEESQTIREFASLLKIGEKTAYSMAQNTELPGGKVQAQWRFRRSDIDAWIDEQARQGGDNNDVNEPEEGA